MLLNINQHIESLFNNRFFPAFFISLLTIFSLVVIPGYESFTSDQALFIPPLYHSLDPTLFPNDIAWWDEMFTNQTFLTELLAFFIKQGVDIFLLLFLLSAISRLLFFTALYFIIKNLTANRTHAFVGLLFFVTPFWIPGTGHTTIENAFSYRAIALPLGLTVLTFTLHNRYLFAVLPLVLGYIIHPITAMPFILFFYGVVAKKIWQKRMHLSLAYKDLVTLCIATTVLGLFTLAYSSGATNNFFLVIDEQWKALAHPRNSPAFFAFWDRNSFLSLVLWISLGFALYNVARRFLEQYSRFLFLLALSIPLFLLGAAVAGEYTSWHGLLKINFQRGIFFFNIFIPILVVLYTFRESAEKKDIYEQWLLFSIIGWFLWKENFVFLREQMFIFIPSLVVFLIGNMVPILRHNKRFRILFAISVLVLFVGFATKLSIRYADYQSLSIFFLILGVGFIFARFLQKYPQYETRSLQCGIATGCAILIIAAMTYLPLFTIYPHFYYNTAYREACRWVETNTSHDSVFIVEPFLTDAPEEFRLACFRPIFTTFKEGGIVPYNPNRDDAFDWKHRYDLAYAIQDNWETIENIKKEYRVDYIFSEKQLPIEKIYPLVFQNGDYFIYDIR